jgi:alpha-L-fucosidase
MTLLPARFPLCVSIPRSLRRIGVGLAIAAFGLHLVAAETSAPVVLRTVDEPDLERDARVAWHKEARFGCFVHWGVYSALENEWHGKKGGGYAEHIMRVMKIPRATYLEEVAKPFNPVSFDADAWVKLMRDAGMRYLVITAKHHDGFAMYPSKVSDYNITVTKFKRDPMAELSAACKKYGLKFGFYYSHAFDWEHPDAPGNDWDYQNPGGDLNRDDPDWWSGRRPDFLPKAQHYVSEKSIPQIQELLRTYHPDILWFDTPGKLPPEENRRILEALRATDSHVVVNGRLLRDYGDYKSTADRPAYFPATAGHWEGIPTTNESYGYSKFDHSHKPPEHFIRLIAQSVSKGGNVLMNIGPKGDGTIDSADEKILRGIGAWMQQNGESIYGCDRTPLAVQGWGTSTRKGERLYLHVFQWPKSGKLLVAGLKSDPSSVHLLAKPDATLSMRRVTANDLEIAVPAEAPDPVDAVIALDFNHGLAIDPARYVSPSDPTALHVMDGELVGNGIRYGDGKRDNDCTLGWKDNGSGVDWLVRVPVAGKYRVSANYATAKPAEGGGFKITAGDRSLAAVVKPTAKANAFATVDVGELELPAGEFTLSVRPTAIASGDLMRLRILELVPASN